MENLIKFDVASDAWLGLDDNDYLIQDNPLLGMEPEDFFRKNLGTYEISLLRNPDYLGYTAWVILGMKIPPFQQLILRELWTRPFPMLIGSRGLSKTTCLALYSLLRCLLYPDYKIVVAGASFRQSKMIFEYVENMFHTSPVLRSMCRQKDGAVRNADKWEFHINDSLITAIPIGPTGDKVRGLRANSVICDEFSSHTPQIVEEVLFGFGVVSSTPVEKLINIARREKMQQMGCDMTELEALKDIGYSNQSIIAGTADYYFNHFYDYWMRYKRIIESKGDPQKLKDVPGADSEAFDWKDFSVIRIPYSMLPKGFMDDKVIARARSQMSTSLYKKEYEAIFIEDSDGFFKRSIIEACTAKEKNISKESWVEWCPTPFDPVRAGDKNRHYVYGIDPASEADNFAVTILECYKDHARVVYVWTTNRSDFIERQKAGYTKIEDYYNFVVRKVRDLMKIFPCMGISIDAQGGGRAVIEAFHNKNYLEGNEEQIWETKDPNKPKDSDDKRGIHILEAIEFSNYTWLRDANYNLLKDMETKTLLFPRFDNASVELSVIEDMARSERFQRDNPGKKIKLFDSLEDVLEEVERLKDELTNIIHKRGGSKGREKWVVPDVSDERITKKSGQKDRYTALLLANDKARRIRNEEVVAHEYNYGGGLITDIKANGGELYSGPTWFTDKFYR